MTSNPVLTKHEQPTTPVNAEALKHECWVDCVNCLSVCFDGSQAGD